MLEDNCGKIKCSDFTDLIDGLFDLYMICYIYITLVMFFIKLIGKSNNGTITFCDSADVEKAISIKKFDGFNIHISKFNKDFEISHSI